MKTILVLHPFDAAGAPGLPFAGVDVRLRHLACDGDFARCRELIAAQASVVDAIALDGIPLRLQLGPEQLRHELGAGLLEAAGSTPLVDGSGLRPGVERWSVYLAERLQPDLFRDRRVLMVPGLNHPGLADALSLRARRLRFADPAMFFGLPRFPGVGSASNLSQVAAPTLRFLKRATLERLRPRDGARGRLARMFDWAEVLAGDVRTIRALAPPKLRRKIVVTEAVGDDDVADLEQREVATLVTLMPSFDPDEGLARHSAPVIEALLACTRAPGRPLCEDTYLDMISELAWEPAVRFLGPASSSVHRFAFVIHPLEVGFIHRAPRFRWTRHLPAAVVEPLAARMPPMKISRITGARSASTGQQVEGQLIALGATPREMMNRAPEFTYRRLKRAARLAARDGARVIGLGAFTSVVGDAGLTVARDAPIAVTSGNSLTVAATLEAAKQAAVRMGMRDLARGRAMIVGATGSIGSVCARMLAQAIRDVVLISIEPDRLIELKRLIQSETPGARVVVATRARGLLGDCELIVAATSAFGQRIIDISQCMPGAIVCDVARPPDINAAEAALRPDVLVIESGEVLIPGEVDFHYDIGLPPRVAYACLAETALLAMEGRFESFTLGRTLSVERVKEIYRLFQKHGFQLAGLRSLGRYVTDSDIAAKRELAEKLRADPGLFESTRHEAARRLAELPIRSKGVTAAAGPAASLSEKLVAAVWPFRRGGAAT